MSSSQVHIFQIHRLRESQRQHFRSAPHTSGVSVVKPRDYERVSEVEASSEYAAWLLLKDAGTPIQVGDMLESEQGTLRICKYIGFEEARWFVPESAPVLVVPAADTVAPEVI